MQLQDWLSEPEGVPLEKTDTGRRVGRRGLEKLFEGYSYPRCFASRRSWHRASRPRSSSQRMFGRWSIFPFLRGHSARRRVGLVHPSTNSRVGGGFPSSSPSGTPAYSQNGDQPPRCDAFHSEGPVPCLPIQWLSRVIGMCGRVAHNELATPFVNVLLQRSLKCVSEVRNMSPFRLRTNLIVHDSIASVFDQTAQFTRIHDVVEEALDLALACQWFELAGNFIQFPNEPCPSDSGLGVGSLGLLL